MRTAIEQYVIDRAREKRLIKGWTQAELAAKAGYSYGLIGNVEAQNGNKKYNLNNLFAFAKALDCSLKDFFPDKVSDVE